VVGDGGRGTALIAAVAGAEGARAHPPIMLMGRPA
jgi:hypothetical protein